jgi:hypothetical protein
VPIDHAPSEIADHALIFMGDFNYRINGNPKSVIELMKQDLYDVLRYNDQLFIEMKIGTVPTCLKEGVIEFAPTYKRRVGSNTEYAVSRVPAWTDRVLFAYNSQKCELTQKIYDSNNHVTLSDHRPVFAQF